MPPEFVDLITQQDFYFLSGLTGLVSAFIILIIWSRGL